ncbi:hypothetical protein F5I97DRAFT_1929026 [Phlebopus sp. FC_14]|nr:hypothetical protein F5I97DRAFT_1929026 [Phlebopus sp. FC_14]
MADHHPLDDHAVLAEQLQLLNQLRYSDEPMRCEGKKYYHDNGDANAALRVLDTIALVLTTGKPGEVFAAAFDRSQSVTLVLAKNDPVIQEDVQAVHELITTITASTTESAYDVLPFLFSRCRENIERRIRKLIAAVDILLGLLDEILESYTPSHPPDKEFPNSEDYRRYKYPNGEPPFKEMACRLFKDLRAAGVGVDFEDIEETSANFMRLWYAASIILNSGLLRSLRKDYGYFRWKPQAEKLRCRLLKVFNYNQGIDNLIMHAKRFFPNGIKHRWVDPITAGTGETTLELTANHMDVITRAFGDSSAQRDLQTLDKKVPDMQNKWSSSGNVQTRLHVEIRLLLHLSDPFSPMDEPMPIGCSRRTCLCCALWIKAYNWEFGTKWLTNGSNGKPHVDWALPGCSYAHARMKEGRSVVDKAVLYPVSRRLHEKLDLMLPIDFFGCLWRDPANKEFKAQVDQIWKSVFQESESSSVP